MMDHTPEVPAPGPSSRPKPRVKVQKKPIQPTEEITPGPAKPILKKAAESTKIPTELPSAPTHCDKKFCEHCGMKQKQSRKLAVPTEKQTEARKQFAVKVAEAKQLQVENPGLTYKDAIRQVYIKT